MHGRGQGRGVEEEEEEGCLYFRERLRSFTPGRMIGNQLVGASAVDLC